MLERLTSLVSRLFSIAAGAALVLMMALTCLDAILRDINMPLVGINESVTYLGALVLGFSLPMTQRRGGQVGVELLSRKLTGRPAEALAVLVSLVSLILCAVTAWQCWAYAGELKASGEVSMNLGLPVHLVTQAIAVSFGALCLVILNQMVAAIGRLAAK
ncbi:tripartite ATP-independent periplasmic transporter DctQ [Desulfarculus baarsii DSM 2075]|uniref:Tripartite ATP-independent periplasmic transporter DctQ n=1 Tax=Desulfarculus baarsii (strain ATCC 33931 / DSM 2075 / LMG 7858 / VKM B-1802 / 2st14) TaxID=644282 RepID=E1QEN1_DESB2|nr:TRAP transporter small permease [Desulfarculus baarsii]ADK84017.1 tripartite ATP-independent periplasmic transporter DctQ [Desulfarculus baarsii DSM 2075]